MSEPMFTVRDSCEDDLPFIFATWLRSFQKTGKSAQGVLPAIFYSEYHHRLEKLLAREGVRVKVAHLSGEPGVIIGYVVYESSAVPVIHWCYVKGPWRRNGVARTLLTGVPLRKFVFTHWTDGWDRLLPRFNGAVYNPYHL